MVARLQHRTYRPFVDSDTDAPNGKNFSMPLAGPAVPGVVKVIVSVKAKVFEVADPTTFLTDAVRNDDGRNAAASITINYVAAEPADGDPTVYSIRRLSDSLLPVTAATENVIILLSEQPKAFTKDNVDVTNATWIDPVALVAIPEDPNGPDNEAPPGGWSE